ncbi:UNKNOWN [Stylonychia lemnae]|uniref:Morn repeat protein n=1 Tax=Stylonychia lemnae TaxID=5949 RepID=A0A078ADR3_STYLE|nr:UNKNOWN [Stylonychia lemnae]|eukprot:CDW79672.1 UNKNOWN [Stylonychia lemnae]
MTPLTQCAQNLLTQINIKGMDDYQMYPVMKSALSNVQQLELQIINDDKMSLKEKIRQQKYEREHSRYDIVKMIKDNNNQIVPQQPLINYGPEFRDPRLNEDYLLHIKNKIDGEQFWISYISDSSALTEIRWDLFEDGMLKYLQDKIIFNQEELTRVNWKLFFTILLEVIAHNENEYQSECPQYPISTTYANHQEDYMSFRGKKVRKSDWINFIKERGFSQFARECMVVYNKDQEGNKLREDEMVKKLAQIKNAQRNRITYEDGTIYEGSRDHGRRHGKGILSLASRRGIYNGDFNHGKRHGYGIQTSHNMIINKKADAQKQEEKTKKQINGEQINDTQQTQMNNEEDDAIEIPQMVYKGEWRDDMRHGFGVQEFYDGSKFEGQWAYNKQSFGTYIWPDGSEYVGEFNGCHIEGLGTMKLEREVIKGKWRNGKLHGEGERKFMDGEKYICKNWINGKMFGKGEHHTKDGSFFGYFQENKESGRGKKVSHVDGYQYEGYFENGLFCGQGKQIFKNGDVYIGEFKDGFRHGKGIFKFANGDQYEGEWQEDYQNGYGILKIKYDSSFGKLDAVYKGNFKDGLYNGKGFFEVPDFQIYDGDFVNGMKEGFGKFVQVVDDVKRDYFKEQVYEVYEGQWKNNKFHGLGKFKYSDGVEYNGMWKDGLKDGKGTLSKGDQVLTALFQEDYVIGPNWNEHIDVSLLNMKIYDKIFGSEEWKKRPKDNKGDFISDNLDRIGKRYNE